MIPRIARRGFIGMGQRCVHAVTTKAITATMAHVIKRTSVDVQDCRLSVTRPLSITMTTILRSD